MSTIVDRATEIRPFRIEVSEERIEDLRRRIEATRFPSKELVEDRSQGVQPATIQELARYWRTEYDFSRTETRLNALPQFPRSWAEASTRAWRTSTRSTGAVTLPLGRSRSSSPPRCELHSAHCAR
jgi:Epoxide hydrolase N terminus